MKSRILLSFLAILAFSFTSNAQLKTFSRSGETATNADTILLIAQSQGYNAVTTIQLHVAKVSGTVGGSAIIEGSLDGTNYVATGADTLTLTNASQTKIWRLGNSDYVYYRIKYITTGTQASIPTALVLFRKP